MSGPNHRGTPESQTGMSPSRFLCRRGLVVAQWPWSKPCHGRIVAEAKTRGAAIGFHAFHFLFEGHAEASWRLVKPGHGHTVPDATIPEASSDTFPGIYILLEGMWWPHGAG